MKFLSFIQDTLKSIDFLYLFIIIFIGSLSIMVYNIPYNTIIGIVGMSAVISFVVALIVNAFSFKKKIKLVLLILFAIIFNLLTITDLFLVVTFHKPFDQDMIDIVAESNARETAEFFATYLPWYSIITIAVFALLINLCLYKELDRIKGISRNVLGYIMSALVILGVCSTAYSVYNFVVYHNGNSIPQYTSLTRSAHALSILKNRVNAIASIYDKCEKLKDNISYNAADSTIYVVIIGESFSKYHSSLYGYEVETNPKLQQRADSGEMVVFSDVVSFDDHTHTVMKSIFSFSKNNKNFESHSLFPAAFRQAGYHTALYDNQYFLGNGISFLSDRNMSKMMFDFRNENGYGHDGNMFADVEIPASRGLIVIHLIGQHYTYKDRYPKDFSCNITDDLYKSYSPKHRETVKCYDTSIVYTDSIIDAFLDRLNDKNAVLIYFSDHGEEVYEYGDYMGHGNAAQSAGMKNQIEVPFMIWGSPTFRQSDNWQRLVNAKNKKITTDDLSHLLIDLAEIKIEEFNPERSPINDEYVDKDRTVLSSINYDK